MRGFTSVRDMAGPSFGLKRAIDAGHCRGPAHMSLRRNDLADRGPRRLPLPLRDTRRAERAPEPRRCDRGRRASPTASIAVLMRAREQLMLGASQLKLAAGGGVSSSYDPIDVSQYTEAEFRAAVDAAENWGTYVAVHAYTPRAIRTAIRGGVRCIEHGQLMDEATAQDDRRQRRLAQHAAVSRQSNSPTRCRRPKGGEGPAGLRRNRRRLSLRRGIQAENGLGHRHPVRSEHGGQPGRVLATLARWYSPVEILRMATSVNGELSGDVGPAQPYPGKLGVVEKGALADLILVDGDPLADIGLAAPTRRRP